MVRYVTALRLGTTEAEQVLGRFARGSGRGTPPIRLQELGRVVRTIFADDYLASEELRREIHIKACAPWQQDDKPAYTPRSPPASLGSETPPGPHNRQAVPPPALGALTAAPKLLHALHVVVGGRQLAADPDPSRGPPCHPGEVSSIYASGIEPWLRSSDSQGPLAVKPSRKQVVASRDQLAAAATAADPFSPT
jgi:hypothetical protein